MHFQEKLTRLLDRQRLSKKALGDAIGTSHTTIGRWLTGERVPRDQLVRRVADYFGVPVEVLLDDKLELPIDPMLADYAREHPEEIKKASAAVGKNLSTFVDTAALTKTVSAIQTQLDALKDQIAALQKK